MNDFIQGLRRDLGMKVIPANKAKMGVLRCLNRGEALCHDVRRRRAGRRRHRRLLRRAGRVLQRAGPHRPPHRRPRHARRRRPRQPTTTRSCCPASTSTCSYETTGDEEADVRALTQAIARSFEGFVRRFPDQWFAFRDVCGEAEAQPGVGARQMEDSQGDWRLWSLKARHAGSATCCRAPAAYAIARLRRRPRLSASEAAPARDVEDNMRHVLGAGRVAVRGRRRRPRGVSQRRPLLRRPDPHPAHGPRAHARQARCDCTASTG